MSWEEILWQRSFVNLQMLLSAIPESDFDAEEIEKEEKKQQQAQLGDFFSKATF